jgi:flagellar biosynthetic protein FliR
MYFQQIALELLNHVNIAWSLILLIIRFTGFFYTVPGLGEGAKGITIRAPAIMIFAYSCLRAGSYAVVPDDAATLVLQAGSEFLFGMIVGLVPFLIVSGVQTAAQLSSTSMGFGAGQLFDPTSGSPISDVGRICGDLTVLIFLSIGGDQVCLYALSGLAGNYAIGTYIPTELSINILIDRTSHIFYLGVMLSAPVMVALLLTQFVMGLITRAVPTVNIFIVSFPLTIGIGLSLTILALPDIMVYVKHEMTGIEGVLMGILEDVRKV